MWRKYRRKVTQAGAEKLLYISNRAFSKKQRQWLTEHGVENSDDARRETSDVERRGPLDAPLGEAGGGDKADGQDHALRENLEERSKGRGHHGFNLKDWNQTDSALLCSAFNPARPRVYLPTALDADSRVD